MPAGADIPPHSRRCDDKKRRSLACALRPELRAARQHLPGRCRGLARAELVVGRLLRLDKAWMRPRRNNPLACRTLAPSAAAARVHISVRQIFCVSLAAGGDSARLWAVDGQGSLHEHALRASELAAHERLRSVCVLDCAALAVEASGSDVLVAGPDANARCLDTRTAMGRPAWTILFAHSDEIFCLQCDAVQAEQFLTSSADETVKLWDVRALSSSTLTNASDELEPLQTFDGSTGTIFCGTFARPCRGR